MNKKPLLSDTAVRVLKRQHYYLVGGHSAVKICHWTHEKIKTGRVCYKEKFYGINCHRCLQMTPAVNFCTQQCIFCWRPWEIADDVPKDSCWDEPDEIIDDCIKGQRLLLSGYFGAPELFNQELLKEAQDPRHAAISLSGEPTMYPYLSDLISAFHKRNMTTFLVSNANNPKVLKNLDSLPTQLYLSLDAPSKELHKKINAPLIENSWERINDSLELFPSLDTRRVLRITAVKNINMVDPKGYAELIKKSQTDFVEIKAYMFVGYSRHRLSIENMPSHAEVQEFSKQVAEHCGMEIVAEVPASRVVLFSNNSKGMKIKF
ncbi:MAG: 4-demethylwyosine synthase TYW1 [Candidatus Diapherotrites archaeon]|nr:4-demethylwyosine synthase TYW1 [Candidatus Diapherotrites archaeon]